MKTRGRRVFHFAFFVFRFSFFVAVCFSLTIVPSFGFDLGDFDEVVFDHFLVAGGAALLGGVEQLLLHERRDLGPVTGADADFFFGIGADFYGVHGGGVDALSVFRLSGVGGLGMCG